MNDNAYAYDIAENLINMARVLFAPGETDLQAAEESLVLDQDEIEEVLHKPYHAIAGIFYFLIIFRIFIFVYCAIAHHIDDEEDC